MTINKVALAGLGAIGSINAIKFHKCLGDNFAVVAGGSRAERIRKNGEAVNGDRFFPRVYEPGQDEVFDLIVIVVKNTQLDAAIEDIKCAVGPKTVILPLLNGVSAVEKVKDAYPENTVLYGLSRADAFRTAEGIVCTTEGTTEFGLADNTVMTEDVAAVKEVFDRANLSCMVPVNMRKAKWLKFMRNVALNQLSAVLGATYWEFANVPELYECVRQVMTEVKDVANAIGVDITAEEVEEAAAAVAKSDPNGKTSMLQDIEGKRKTEVDSFAGSMIKIGKENGVPTPWNDRLYLMIKTIESRY